MDKFVSFVLVVLRLAVYVVDHKLFNCRECFCSQHSRINIFHVAEKREVKI